MRSPVASTDKSDVSTYANKHVEYSYIHIYVPISANSTTPSKETLYNLRTSQMEILIWTASELVCGKRKVDYKL
jgi:hypothetical protein